MSSASLMHSSRSIQSVLAPLRSRISLVSPPPLSRSFYFSYYQLFLFCNFAALSRRPKKRDKALIKKTASNYYIGPTRKAFFSNIRYSNGIPFSVNCGPLSNTTVSDILCPVNIHFLFTNSDGDLMMSRASQLRCNDYSTMIW